MPLVTGPGGERYHFSVPYTGERFQVTRYGTLEKSDRFPQGRVDHIAVKDSASGDSIRFGEEDAELLDGLCAALKAGEIQAPALEEKLVWYFEVACPKG